MPNYRRLVGARPARCALARSADDAAAFREFYDAYVERVIVFFSRRTLEVEAALDLTSETFAIALERRRQFRGLTLQEEQGWLFAIARSQLSRFWRQGQVERDALARVGLDPPGMTQADIERVEDLAGLAQMRSDLVRALSDLSTEQAYAVGQRVLGERSYTEMAEELGVTEQVVRARVSRGLRALAESLSEWDVEEVA